MFYCDECAEKNSWPDSLSKSLGPCELCNKRSICNDLPCSLLPNKKLKEDNWDDGRFTDENGNLLS